jgi:Amt family ammonium transporter
MSSNSTAIDCVPDPGDTAFMFFAAVLVLSMLPGLAFFEAGLLRRRSALSIVTQIFVGLAVLNMMWFLFGFSLVYGGTHGYVIGDFRWALFNGLANKCLTAAPNIPALLFATFQMMFASITPLLCTGAFAERLRILGFIPFVMLWELLIYYPVAHSIWGDGWMGQLGVLDFAGGITIHTTAGVSSTVCALVMGKRQGYDKYHGEFPAHNIPLAAIGAAFLFTGWNGFNSGSAGTAGFLSIQASTNTVIGASSAACVWALISVIKFRKRIDPLFVLNGTVVGLAGITPCSGYIETWAAFCVGIILGLAAYASLWLMKEKLHVDDALDVGSVHGVPGIVGALMIGFFATKTINPQGADGVFYGGGRQLWVQVVGIVVTSVWTVIITFPLIWLLRRFKWSSLQPQHEHLGLDGKDHHTTAYAGLEEENTIIATHAAEEPRGVLPVYNRTTMNLNEFNQRNPTAQRREMATPLLQTNANLSE